MLSRQTIRNILNKNNIVIESKPQKKNFTLSRDDAQAYIDSGKTIKDISEIINAPQIQVSKTLNDYGIEYKRVPNKHPVPMKEELETLYQDSLNSQTQIAEKYGVSVPTVSKWLKTYDIKKRTHSENHLIHNNNPMSKEDFLLLCVAVHGDLYDYSNVRYTRAGCSDKIEVICRTHGSFFVRPQHHTSLGNGCPSCSHIVSSGELSIRDYIQSLDSELEIITNDRTLGIELDILIPKHMIAIEYNGVYWHSSKFKDSNYHLMKTDTCLKNGIKLLHIFEDSWLTKQDICKSMIKNKLGLIDKEKRIYARKCTVSEVSAKDSEAFFNENHLQGKVRSKIAFGLYCEGVLVSCMSFGKSRYNKKYEYELLRYANRVEYSVIGSASRLLKAFQRVFDNPSLISYSDRRHSVGNVYEKIGFKYSHTSNPSYWYFRKGSETVLYNRVGFQKHKLESILDTYDRALTEYENMCNNGYYRIYDCGNDVWVLDGN